MFRISALYRIGALGLVAALAVPAGAQTSFLLKDMVGTRGLVAQGKGGLLATTPVSPLRGELGRDSAFVDLNGDGFADLVVGAPGLPTSPGSGALDDAGHVYILFGSASKGAPGSSSAFSFASFTQGQAIDLLGDPGDKVGGAIAAIGDIDGDGFQDIAIGAPGHSAPGRTASGGVYLIFGRADWATLPKTAFLSQLASGVAHRGMLVEGARAFAANGSSVSGNVDVNADGRDDVVIGAPYDSTNGRTQNGTATVLYGQVGFPYLASVDLATQVAGQVTVVHGTADFQLLGYSVAGVGKFDAVLPLTNNQANPTLGDDVAIGAPGTTVGSAFFAGAVYVMRGTTGVVPAASYTADQFGNGPNKAGVVYTGAAAGDQAGFHVAAAGDILYDGQGFDDLIVTAPFSDAFGRPDAGSIYLLAGNFLGVNPQGFDLGLLGKGDPSILGVHIQGAQTGNGQQGVFAANAGDWNGDNLPDLLVGFPNATYVSGSNVYVGAGRARVLDGAKVLFALGTVDLADTTKAWDLMTLGGEATGGYVGCGLASGDFNGDGHPDVSVGGWGSPSDPDPLDLSGLGNSRTGRSHLVYGPVLRPQSISPTISHYGGPTVTVTASNVPVAAASVLVDGKFAEVVSQVSGNTGSVTFKPPKPLAPGALADVQLNTTNGKVTLVDSLQYKLLSVTTGPNPPTGFSGSTSSFTGQAFSTLADMQVTIGGFAATVTAVDGMAGTLSMTLPSGPPPDVPLDVVVSSANGSQTLPGAMTYLGLVVSSVSPNSGKQTSGVYVDDPMLPYKGEPALSVAITAPLATGSLPPNPLVEFGNATVGYRVASVKSVVGNVITVDLPTFLLGAQKKVDVRVTANGEQGTLPDGFTYLASDFQALGQYEQAGFGSTPHQALMAGIAGPGQDVLLVMGPWPPQMQLAVLFLGLDLEDPPVVFKGGPFGIDISLPFFSFFFPFPGLPGANIYQKMPAVIDPGANGVPLYLQVVTKEKSGPATKWGFSNVLKLTLHTP